ncbi:klaroid isoform a-related [Anaeramoeba ignava]|uniref:Klaroid isoform a-related n=1 Tax=Anaeramoeba ignava TaxID=1746090 RepID=A0A9Q0LQH8_ANAIG|nr:klaroid isoform a-related [Anaeramoeba ignava]|eukprot:Anaeramoba_ignava/a609948_145.p1 GENE.a609948_145~~a609948_145.p1  ORF type:complete len:890 (-),score=280.78 a609948_145:926-3595(-)
MAIQFFLDLISKILSFFVIVINEIRGFFRIFLTFTFLIFSFFCFIDEMFAVFLQKFFSFFARGNVQKVLLVLFLFSGVFFAIDKDVIGPQVQNSNLVPFSQEIIHEYTISNVELFMNETTLSNTVSNIYEIIKKQIWNEITKFEQSYLIKKKEENKENIVDPEVYRPLFKQRITEILDSDPIVQKNLQTLKKQIGSLKKDVSNLVYIFNNTEGLIQFDKKKFEEQMRNIETIIEQLDKNQTVTDLQKKVFLTKSEFFYLFQNKQLNDTFKRINDTHQYIDSLHGFTEKGILETNQFMDNLKNRKNIAEDNIQSVIAQMKQILEAKSKDSPEMDLLKKKLQEFMQEFYEKSLQFDENFNQISDQIQNDYKNFEEKQKDFNNQISNLQNKITSQKDLPQMKADVEKIKKEMEKEMKEFISKTRNQMQKIQKVSIFHDQNWNKTATQLAQLQKEIPDKEFIGESKNTLSQNIEKIKAQSLVTDSFNSEIDILEGKINELNTIHDQIKEKIDVVMEEVNKILSRKKLLEELINEDLDKYKLEAEKLNNILDSLSTAENKELVLQKIKEMEDTLASLENQISGINEQRNTSNRNFREVWDLMNKINKSIEEFNTDDNSDKFRPNITNIDNEKTQELEETRKKNKQDLRDQILQALPSLDSQNKKLIKHFIEKYIDQKDPFNQEILNPAFKEFLDKLHLDKKTVDFLMTNIENNFVCSVDFAQTIISKSPTFIPPIQNDFVDNFKKLTQISLVPIREFFTQIPLLQRTKDPRYCWSFSGYKGFLIIELSHLITPKNFTLEHISSSVSPLHPSSTAPKSFTVLGSSDSSFTNPVSLGHFQFDNNGSPIQTFPVNLDSDSISPQISFVKLEIDSNYGADYTSICRFRVHGIPVKIMD